MNRLQKFKHNLEIKIEASERCYSYSKVLLYFRTVILYMVCKSLEVDYLYLNIKELINPVKFYNFTSSKKVSELIAVSKIENKIIEPSDRTVLDRLIKWSTQPHFKPEVRGTIARSRPIKPPKYFNPIDLQLDKFAKEVYEGENSYRQIVKFWATREMQFPNERWLYSKVHKSVKNNEQNLKELLRDRGQLSGKELMEII